MKDSFADRQNGKIRTQNHPLSRGTIATSYFSYIEVVRASQCISFVYRPAFRDDNGDEKRKAQWLEDDEPARAEDIIDEGGERETGEVIHSPTESQTLESSREYTSWPPKKLIRVNATRSPSLANHQNAQEDQDR